MTLIEFQSCLFVKFVCLSKGLRSSLIKEIQKQSESMLEGFKTVYKDYLEFYCTYLCSQ